MNYRAIFVLIGALVMAMPAPATTFATSGPKKPLIEAARASDLSEVTRLLERGAAIDQADALGRTALHYAAALGDDEVTEVLIRMDAGVNLVDQDGFTPLMRAAQNGHKNLVTGLLRRGADMSLKNVVGQTARDLAQSRGYDGITRLLGR